MKPEKPDTCSVCCREVVLSFHHFVPKKLHGKSAIKELHSDKDLVHYGTWLCLDCHKKIHRSFSHQQLAEEFYTLKDLLANPEFFKFVCWVKKQKRRVK